MHPVPAEHSFLLHQQYFEAFICTNLPLAVPNYSVTPAKCFEHKHAMHAHAGLMQLPVATLKSEDDHIYR